MDLKNKKVLVVGLARSGKAAIRLLHKMGAEITLSEKKEPDSKEKAFLEEYQVRRIGQELEDLGNDYDLVVKNPGVPPIAPLVSYFKTRKIPIYSEIELAYQLARPQHYIGITGTNGKTTTTTIVYELLKKHYPEKALVGGNIGTPLSELVLDYDLLHNEGYYIALELSNHQLVDIDQFTPEIATIINLTPDHLATMGSLENYYRSKTEIYRNMNENDIFLYNLDDPLVESYTAKYPLKAKRYSFSLRKEADCCIKDGAIFFSGKKLLPLSAIRIVGQHNIQNIMIAAMAAYLSGVSSEEIEAVISEFNGVEHRIEFVREIAGVRYYNDSKGTNTDASITALKAFKKGVILLVGGFEKGLDMTEMKKYLQPVKEVIGFGAAGPRIASDLYGEKARIVTDLKEAVELARKLARPGDTVLLSPTTSSFDQYSSYEERGRHFKNLVNSL